MNFLHTKPQVKNMKYNSDLFYTVLRIRDQNKDIENQYIDDDIDYIDINNYIKPNHKHRETMLKY